MKNRKTVRILAIGLGVLLSLSVFLSGCSSFPSKEKAEQSNVGSDKIPVKELSGKIDVMMAAAEVAVGTARSESPVGGTRYMISSLSIKDGTEISFSENVRVESVSTAKYASVVDANGKRHKGDVTSIRFEVSQYGSYDVYVIGDIKLPKDKTFSAGETIFTVSSGGLHFPEEYDTTIKPKTNSVVRSRSFNF